MTLTYLMIKEHSITGLKYLCKTSKYDPYKYLGSGKYWKRHIKDHGKEHVKTIWVSDAFTDKGRLIEFATFMSEELDIVKSDKWANLMNENGIDGWTAGASRSEETKEKIRGKPAWNKGLKGQIPWNKGKAHVGKAAKGVSRTKEAIANMSKPRKRVICPHCNKEGGGGAMKQHHFNKCKAKSL